MTCISTLPAYQTGYHLYDLRPEILINPYQAAQVRTARHTNTHMIWPTLDINVTFRWRSLANCSTFQYASSQKYHF
jgi:hypothetical protein